MELVEIFDGYFVNSRYITHLYEKDGECHLETTKHCYKISQEKFDEIIAESDLLC